MSEEYDKETTLRLLCEVELGSARSQRSISDRLGIAVGLTNAYIRRCVRKGWIKVSKAPARRYAYYLTPRGFSEKSRLTAEYLASSLQFFRDARSHCAELLEWAEQCGWTRVAMYGASELAEIAVLATGETNVQIVAVVAPAASRREYAGVPVVADLESLNDIDAVLLTDISHPQRAYEQVRRQMDEARLLVPGVLNVSRTGPEALQEAGLPESGAVSTGKEVTG